VVFNDDRVAFNGTPPTCARYRPGRSTIRPSIGLDLPTTRHVFTRSRHDWAEMSPLVETYETHFPHVAPGDYCVDHLGHAQADAAMGASAVTKLAPHSIHYRSLVATWTGISLLV
jgi:hypothetical protein